MKPGLSIKLLTALFAVAFAGCVSAPASLDSSPWHPGNPRASKSPEAPLKPILMAGSQGLVLPLSTNQTEMQHGHQQQKPASKGAQSRPGGTEHKHNHEQPKRQEEKK